VNVTLTKSFFANASKLLKHFPKAKPDIFDFIDEIRLNPKGGDAVPGFQGMIYKIRGPLKSYGIGKQGGLRAYYFFNEKTIAIFFIYTKKDMADARHKTIKELVAALLEEFPSTSKS
jgi:hypothetical protein